MDQMDCGPTCLRIIAKFYGRNISLKTLRKLCGITREGVSLYSLGSAAEKIGFQSTGVRLSLIQIQECNKPCILHWRQNHFVVLYKIRKSTYYIVDPGVGRLKLNEETFMSNWAGENIKGAVLLLDPKEEFKDKQDENDEGVSWSIILRHLLSYRKLLMQLFLGLFIGSILQLLIPFLTQSVIDIGINSRNLRFIYILLLGQGMIIAGRICADFFRSWILLHVSTRINISILTDFLIKLMKLPISFFDAKMTGDILQRMNDQYKIENFLTTSTLSTLFSFSSFVIFSVVLGYYNMKIFIVFLFASSLYVAWVFLFLKRRRDLNYQIFDVMSKNQSNIVQLISGMQEIKLNNSEMEKRWDWERIQATAFSLNVKNLALTQYQQGGAAIINEGSNLLIIFLCSKSVIEGQLTLGAMMAMQYIIGQLTSPIQQFIGFVQNYQDAKISLERLNEIHHLDDEEPTNKEVVRDLPENKGIKLDNMSFSYPGTMIPAVKNITLDIPEGKTTAIVGTSGSGKTTLLKLLLRFYEPTTGEIAIDGRQLSEFSIQDWRRACGVVMQDGFIFSDSFERNITIGNNVTDQEKLSKAIKIANLQDFIDSLPLGLNTKLGADGNGISQGQRQRLLIARAVYKNPHFIFFDEATNALDTNNERVIMKNLYEFFAGRTVIIVAHRLSTVNNADNIVVLDKGEIIEEGTHRELIKLKGHYYQLVKNQLELDS